MLQYLESCLQFNFITLFTTIYNLFNHLKDIFGKSYEKKHIIKKFQKLKMRASLFSDFYFEFIQLDSDLEYISEMLI